MCNACGFVCCASDMFSGCGCDHCECEQCWPDDDVDDAADYEEWAEAECELAGGSQAPRAPGASAGHPPAGQSQ